MYIAMVISERSVYACIAFMGILIMQCYFNVIIKCNSVVIQCNSVIIKCNSAVIKCK